MAIATFSDEILQTVSGTKTAWLPLTSPWISIAACSSQLYAQPDLSPVIAFDPFYYSVFASDQIPCLPTEFTSWWEQPESGKTVYVLGPTFVCPAAYTALQTILVNSATQQILCCPQQYTLLAPITANPPTGFPSQCYSSPKSGEVLTYMTQSDTSGTWTPFTRTIEVDAFYVYALPVNGYNVIATTTTNLSSSAPTTSSAGSATITPPPLTPSAPSTSAPSNTSTASGSTSSGLSAGATAGVGIGAAAGLILVAILGWYLYKRRKSAVMSHEHVAWAESNLQPPMAAYPSGSIQPQELPHKNSPTPYEIG